MKTDARTTTRPEQRRGFPARRTLRPRELHDLQQKMLEINRLVKYHKHAEARTLIEAVRRELGIEDEDG